MTAEALQIFAGSPRTWKQGNYSDEEAAAFKAAAAKLNMPVYIHMMYLTSYGSPDAKLRAMSIEAATHTMANAEKLGVVGVVTHMGSHKGEGIATVMDDLRDALLKVVTNTKESKLLLENSAGAGGNVGNSLDELAEIYEVVGRDKRIGFCLDTCHLLAAGYEVRTKAGWAAVLDEFDQKIGLDQLNCLHLNDSKFDLGARRDRHENIGQGFIGDAGFRVILNEPRLKDNVGILEVPGIEHKGPDQANLEKLRSLTTG